MFSNVICLFSKNTLFLMKRHHIFSVVQCLVILHIVVRTLCIGLVNNFCRAYFANVFKILITEVWIWCTSCLYILCHLEQHFGALSNITSEIWGRNEKDWIQAMEKGKLLLNTKCVHLCVMCVQNSCNYVFSSAVSSIIDELLQLWLILCPKLSHTISLWEIAQILCHTLVLFSE